MRKNRKWLFALLAIVLMTLTAGGGALALDYVWTTGGGDATYVWIEDKLTQVGAFVAGDTYATNGPDYLQNRGTKYYYTHWNNGITGGSGSPNYVQEAVINYASNNNGAFAVGQPYYSYNPSDPYEITNTYTGTIPAGTQVTVDHSQDRTVGGQLYKYVSWPGYAAWVKSGDIHDTSKPGGGGTTNPTYPNTVWVNRNGAVVYANNNGTLGSQIATLQYGQRLAVQSVGPGSATTHYYVTWGNNQSGYIAINDTTTTNLGGGGGGGNQSIGDVAYVTGGSLALRRTPDGDVIRWYPTGTAVRVTGASSNGWTPVEIVADSSAKGYMMTRYLDFRNFSGGGIGNPGSGWGGGGSGGGSNPSQPLYATVNNPSSSGYVNLRRYANSTSDILGRFDNGQQVIILTYNIDWCEVQIGNLTGFMQTSLLKIGSSSTTPSPTKPPSTSNPTSAVVNNPNPTDRLNLRAQPSTSSTSLARFYNGTQVKVYEYGATWCYVEVQGIRGYMMTAYLSFNGSYVGSGGSGSGGGGSGSSGTQYAVVKNPVSTQKLNLRAQPSTSSTSLGQFYNGTAVTVRRYGAEWCEVTVNGINGYMMTRYLSFSGGTPTTSAQYAVIKNPVASQYLNLRASADINSRSLGQFYNGTSVKILEYGTTWCRVEINGLRGYMLTRYLQIVK